MLVSAAVAPALIIPSLGGRRICFPLEQRLHLNVSWVSQLVVSFNIKSWRSASREKCLSTSCSSSTTHDDSDCLWAWPVRGQGERLKWEKSQSGRSLWKDQRRSHLRWNIFSSMEPVDMNRYRKQVFFCPSRHTRAIAYIVCIVGFRNCTIKLINKVPEHHWQDS